jgi:hypothetical protein
VPATPSALPLVAFCPCPPVLVPEVAQGAASELAELRAGCDAAVAWLVDRAGSVLVVGAGPHPRVHQDGSAGTLAGFGADVRAGGDGPAVLPLSLTIGAWLLDRCGADLPRAYLEVGAAPGGAAQVASLVGSGAPALLVMGDGTARLDERGPGGWDARAVPYDERIAGALAAGDADALAGLDLDEADQLMAAGVPAWRAVGAALRHRDPQHRTPIQGTVLARQSPYGVAYTVATWQPGPAR